MKEAKIIQYIYIYIKICQSGIQDHITVRGTLKNKRNTDYGAVCFVLQYIEICNFFVFQTVPDFNIVRDPNCSMFPYILHLAIGKMCEKYLGRTAPPNSDMAGLSNQTFPPKGEFLIFKMMGPVTLKLRNVSPVQQSFDGRSYHINTAT